MGTLVRWGLDALASMAGIFVVLAIVATVVLAVRLVRHSPSRAFGVTARDAALVTSAAVILVLTLLAPSADPTGIFEPNPRLIPFEDLRDALEGIRDLRLAIAELVGNVLIFIPFGMALRWRFPSLGVLQATGVALVLSVGIELIQALTGNGRWPESTDVITNTVGGLIGAALIRVDSEPERQA
jgi:glycopeptide antibiotics resistance protein